MTFREEAKILRYRKLKKIYDVEKKKLGKGAILSNANFILILYNKYKMKVSESTIRRMFKYFAENFK